MRYSSRARSTATLFLKVNGRSEFSTVRSCGPIILSLWMVLPASNIGDIGDFEIALPNAEAAAFLSFPFFLVIGAAASRLSKLCFIVCPSPYIPHVRKLVTPLPLPLLSLCLFRLSLLVMSASSPFMYGFGPNANLLNGRVSSASDMSVCSDSST